MQVEEFKAIAVTLLEEAIRFSMMGRVDPSYKTGQQVFEDTLDSCTTKQENRIRKMKDIKIVPTFAYGLSCIGITCDLDDLDKEVQVTLSYPMPQGDDTNSFKEKHFDFYISKNGLVFGEKGYNKIVLPHEISFIKLSDVLFDVSVAINAFSETRFARVTREREEREDERETRGGATPAGSDTDPVPVIVDPAKELGLLDAAKENNKEDVGVVVVKSITTLLDGGTKFQEYRLRVFDCGIALYNPKLGNATYFIKLPIPLRPELVEELKEKIDNHNSDEGGSSESQGFIVDFLSSHVHEDFFVEGKNKEELKNILGVSRIVHRGDWRSRVGELFK
jgi:hypothetical protein